MMTKKGTVGIFKSLRWKLIAVFVVLVLAIMSCAGAFLVYRLCDFYHVGFVKEMDTVFTDEYIKMIEEGSVADGGYVENAVDSHKVPLGIDAHRTYYVIYANTGVVTASSDMTNRPDFNQSANYASAISGEIGSAKSIVNRSYMDYAVPVNTPNGRYIIYIRDDKTDLLGLVKKVLDISLQSLAAAVVISIIVGIFSSRRIAKPITNLTKQVRNLAEGEFDTKIENIKSDNEIGVLADSFNDMSIKLREMLSDISTEKNKIEAILQNMTDGVMAFGTDGKIIHINSTAKKMLNIKNIEKYRFDKLFSVLGADILIGDLLYLSDRRSCEREVTKDNLSLKVNLAIFDDERNKTGGVLAVFHDITKQQKLDNSRREFVANVSHELRTPLTTVKSYAETLLDLVKDNKTAETFANTILNETDRMTRLVKDLLVLSSLENTASLNRATFPIKTMINDVVSTMSLVAGEKGHRLLFEQFSDIKDFYGDRDKLEQVLYNIISNSIKYTPNGGKITVRAGTVYHEVHIEVCDTGIGIPEKDLSRIFERFYRVDKARSRDLGGTGLGLAISKSIIDSHGGQIKIQSEYGVGTSVLITLPIEEEPKK